MTANDDSSLTNITPALREPAGRRLWWMIAGLGVVASVVLFFELGDFRSFGTHEAYAVVPAREMISSGNWVVPHSAGLPRLRKPPLSYWVVATSSTLFGEMNEWTVRVPAAVSALLLAIVVGVWAGRWYGKTAGLGAALVQLTSAWVIIYARKAEVDMLLCLLTTSAMFLIAEGRSDESRGRAFLRWCGIFALVSVSWMAKFHFGPAMVMIPCVLYFVLQKRFRSLLHLANPIGLLMAAAAVLIWPYLVLQQMPEAWDIWKQETVGRAVGSLNRQPLWFYVPYLLWLPLPWTGFVLYSIPASLRKAWRQQDSRERFLWVWAAAHLAIVTVSADKHKHYLNAMLPMCSLLAGQTFVRLQAWLAKTQPKLPNRVALIGTAVSVFAVIGSAFLLGQNVSLMSVAVVVLIGLMSVGTITALWLATVQKPAAAGYAAIATFLAAYVCVMAWIMPARDHRQQTVEFAHAIRREFSADCDIVAFGLEEKDPLVFYLDEPVSRLQTVAAIEQRLNRQGRLLLVTYEPLVAELRDLKGIREVTRLEVDVARVAPKHPPLVVLEITRSAVASGSPASRGN
jgi:4-amino-4-deoxy-L-arabinose transferase-like glycosyltransferase